MGQVIAVDGGLTDAASFRWRTRAQRPWIDSSRWRLSYLASWSPALTRSSMEMILATRSPSREEH
jgi:hypothetical protein